MEGIVIQRPVRRYLTLGLLSGGLLLGCQSSRARLAHFDSEQTEPKAVVQQKSPPKDDVEEIVLADAAPTAEENDDVTPVAAEIPAGPCEYTLASLEQLALAHNPAIRQASASVSKAAGFRDQVGTAPNPITGYQGSQLGDRGTDQHVAFVEQEIVLGKKLERNRLVLEQEVQAQLWQVEATRYRVLTDVRSRFYEALAAQRRRELAEEFGKVTAKGVTIAEQRFKALEGSRPEILQAQIQESEVGLIRQRADLAFRAAWTQLYAAIGMPCAGPSAIVGSLRIDIQPRDWEAVYCDLVSCSPELRMACARVARSQANLDRQQVQAIPNLSLMAAGGYDNGTNSSMINTQIGLPVPLFNRNNGNINAAWAEYCRATQEMERLKLNLRSRLATAAQEYDSAAIQVQTYEEQIVPKAQDALRLSEQSYAAGEVDFLQVLVIRRTFFDSNLQSITAQGEFAKANALIDGFLLSNGLDESTDTNADDSLRGQSLGGQ
jgi:cobalt-zinc-cadmium efflux system outer membrane protein